MQGDMLAQGWELLIYGMGTVVIFLALLVIATSIMSRLVTSYFPEPEPAVVAARLRAAAFSRPGKSGAVQRLPFDSSGFAPSMIKRSVRSMSGTGISAGPP